MKSKDWLNRHKRDFYVKKAKKQGYLSRAAYKLIEIENKFHFIANSKKILELGAAPGGWSQVALEINPKIEITAIDILDLKINHPQINFYKDDFLNFDYKKKENYSKNLTDNIKGLKIGIPKEYRVDGMPKEIDQLWENGKKILKESGAEIIDISLPNTKYALPTYYIVAPAEASSNLARYDGVKYGFRAKGENLIDMYEKTRSEGFGAEVQRRIMIGTYVLSSGYYDAYYLKAQKVRKLIKNDFDEAYKKVDAILTPSTPSSAFKIGEKKDDPVSMYLNDIFTVPVNLAGLPGISIPAGYDAKGYPLGLQIIGKAFDEQNILNIAYAMEEKINFKNKITDWWIK